MERLLECGLERCADLDLDRPREVDLCRARELEGVPERPGDFDRLLDLERRPDRDLDLLFILGAELPLEPDLDRPWELDCLGEGGRDRFFEDPGDGDRLLDLARSFEILVTDLGSCFTHMSSEDCFCLFTSVLVMGSTHSTVLMVAFPTIEDTGCHCKFGGQHTDRVSSSKV